MVERCFFGEIRKRQKNICLYGKCLCPLGPAGVEIESVSRSLLRFRGGTEGAIFGWRFADLFFEYRAELRIIFKSTGFRNGLIESDMIEDKEMLKKCTIFYNCIGGDSNICDVSLDILDGVTDRDINRQLKPMLNKNDHFKKDTVISAIVIFFSASSFFAKLMRLSRI